MIYGIKCFAKIQENALCNLTLGFGCMVDHGLVELSHNAYLTSVFSEASRYTVDGITQFYSEN